jgi:hypothetical protein
MYNKELSDSLACAQVDASAFCVKEPAYALSTPLSKYVPHKLSSRARALSQPLPLSDDDRPFIVLTETKPLYCWRPKRPRTRERTQDHSHAGVFEARVETPSERTGSTSTVIFRFRIDLWRQKGGASC